MTDALSNLVEMEYPGRFIIIGQDPSGENNVVVYGITGRSPPSQARRLILENNKVFVEPTDEEELKKGNPDLLIYDAIIANRALVVSNGAQTETIDHSYLQCQTYPMTALVQAFSKTNSAKWSYEPDPNFTPRIGGIVTRELDIAGLGILKRANNGETLRNYFEFPLIPGEGKLLATYTGINKNPLPSFEGEPMDILLEGKTPKEVAEAVYDAIGPKYRGEDKDFRVSVAAAFQKRDVNEIKNKFYIVNRHKKGA